jgi:hypothetical protein
LPALSSDQARSNGAQPRMSELELQRLLRDLAAGVPNAELCERYSKAPSTIYNLKVKYRDRIDEIARKWAVQFEDLHMTRKQSRLDDIQELRDLAWDQLRALLASNTVIDGHTGEIRSGPVDAGKFKVFAELILRANRNFAEETGQLPQRVERLDERWTRSVLGLSGGGIDYAATARRRQEREASAPQREAEERERKAEQTTRLESIQKQLLASVSDGEQRKERRAFGMWLADEERRLAEVQGSEDDWAEEDFALLRTDVERLFPGDEAVRARVERLIEAVSRDSSDAVDDEQTDVQTEEQDVDVEIVRMMHVHLNEHPPERKASDSRGEA